MKSLLTAKTGTGRHAVVSISKARENSLGPTVAERMAAGKALRDRVPRTRTRSGLPRPIVPIRSRC